MIHAGQDALIQINGDWVRPKFRRGKSLMLM